MRMSDIIKMCSKSPAVPGEKHGRPEVAAGEDPSISMKRLRASALIPEDDQKAIDELYIKFSSEMKTIFNRALISFDMMPPASQIKDLASEIASRLQLSNVNIMDFFMRRSSNSDNYLSSHSVNVTLLSLMMGIWLRYNKSQLIQLAIASMFHDIGMIRVLEKAELPRRLSASEKKEIDDHPLYSAVFIEHLECADIKAQEAVRDHHRRLVSGARTPSEFSQIIGLADVFEAMTHPRAYKKAKEPHRAIRTIVEEMRSKFDRNIIKSLVDNIGIYPAGTLVELNSGEIGLVIDVNPGSPLSPKVNILFSKDLNRLHKARTVDLAKQTNVHIKAPAGEEVQKSIKEQLY